MVKNLLAMWETWVWTLGWEYLLEKGKATHSHILARRVHGVAELDTTKRLSFHFYYLSINYFEGRKLQTGGGGEWSATQHNKNLIFLK